jgi:hypothetical protein
MEFNQIYSECVKRVTSLLKRNSISEDPANFVNEAYMRMFDTGEEITSESLFHKSAQVAMSDLYAAPSKACNSNATTKVCPYCKNEYPVAYFGTYFRKKKNRTEVNSYCRNCRSALNTSMERKEYQKHYRSKVPKEDRAAYARRETRRIPDYYIRTILMMTGWKKEDINQDVIEQRRQQIIRKRIERSKVKNTKRC